MFKSYFSLFPGLPDISVEQVSCFCWRWLALHIEVSKILLPKTGQDVFSVLNETGTTETLAIPSNWEYRLRTWRNSGNIWPSLSACAYYMWEKKHGVQSCVSPAQHCRMVSLEEYNCNLVWSARAEFAQRESLLCITGLELVVFVMPFLPTRWVWQSWRWRVVKMFFSWETQF